MWIACSSAPSSYSSGSRTSRASAPSARYSAAVSVSISRISALAAASRSRNVAMRRTLPANPYRSDQVSGSVRPLRHVERYAPVSDVLIDLVPVAIGAAAVPVVMIITLLLLNSPAGVPAATLWVAGTITIRLLQGLVFGAVIPAPEGSADDPAPIASLVLLVLSIVLLTTAVKKIIGASDPDDASEPPCWMTAFDSVSPGRAFVYGAVLPLIAVKQWVFTLGAISILEEGELDRGVGIAAYVGFVLVVTAPSIVFVALAALFPARSARTLEAARSWLVARNDQILIVLGLVFGVFFGVRAL